MARNGFEYVAMDERKRTIKTKSGDRANKDDNCQDENEKGNHGTTISWIDAVNVSAWKKDSSYKRVIGKRLIPTIVQSIKNKDTMMEGIEQNLYIVIKSSLTLLLNKLNAKHHANPIWNHFGIKENELDENIFQILEK